MTTCSGGVKKAHGVDANGMGNKHRSHPVFRVRQQGESRIFIGHFAPAFAARALNQDAPKLGLLFIAAQLVDWGFFLLAMFGAEKMRIVPGITAMNPFDFYYYPFTHSLLGTAVWGAALATIIAIITRNAMAATIAGGVVLSHWALDWISHRPDLTLAGGMEKYGLGLWNVPAGTIIVELAIVGLAFWWYLSRTRGPIVPPIILIVTMLVFQAINWFGPEPATAGPAFFITGLLAFAVMTALAQWVGSTRWHRHQVGLSVALMRR